MADTNISHVEKHIASQAERMLTSAMQRKIESLGFLNHVSRDDNRVSTSHAIANTKVGKAAGNKLRYYMNGLALAMPKHGFIQHYGVNGVRESKKGRTRDKPQTTHYNFAAHYFNLPAKNYIDISIKQSGVINYVMTNVSEARCQDVFVRLKNFIETD